MIEKLKEQIKNVDTSLSGKDIPQEDDNSVLNKSILSTDFSTSTSFCRENIRFTPLIGLSFESLGSRGFLVGFHLTWAISDTNATTKDIMRKGSMMTAIRISANEIISEYASVASTYEGRDEK